MDRLDVPLYVIASQASRTDDPRSAMQAILDVSIAFFEASAGCIALVDPDTSQLRIEVQTGLPADIGDLPLRLGQGLTGWSAFHGRAVLASDVRQDPRYISVNSSVTCEMSAPLVAGDQILGAITIDSDSAGAFGEEHLSALTRLADEAALTIHAIWQNKHLRAKARQLETLTNVAQSLVAQLQLQELLDTITHESRTILGSRLSAIYLHQAEPPVLRAESWAGPADFAAPPAADWALLDCLGATVVRTQKMAEFANIQSPEFLELRDVPRDPRIESALFAPMIADGKVIGVLAVFSGQQHRHNNDERRLLGTLANLGAVAITNARLYARVFKSEDTLRKNETVNTLGLLAAEIAHEIRNPLTVIKLLYGSLGLEFPAGDPRTRDTRVIGEKLNQLEAIVSRVLNFAKAPSALHSRWSLDEIVSDTLLLVRLKLHQGKVKVAYEPAAEHLVVDANKGQLQQVLLNLILNSNHAMPDGGTLTLRTAREQRGGAAFAVIDVSDTGCGIPPEVSPRIFDSFLSTRPDGTGLGLAIVKRIMQSHHGDVELVQTSPAGTTLRVALPLAPAG